MCIRVPLSFVCFRCYWVNLHFVLCLQQYTIMYVSIFLFLSLKSLSQSPFPNLSLWIKNSANNMYNFLGYDYQDIYSLTVVPSQRKRQENIIHTVLSWRNKPIECKKNINKSLCNDYSQSTMMHYNYELSSIHHT